MKREIILAVLAVLVLCFVSGAAIAAEEPVSARALYEMDAAKAAEIYKDKPVVVKGIAIYVGPNVYSLPSIQLSDKVDGESYVLCVLPYGDVFKLAEVQKDQELTITGEFRRGSVDGKSVLLKESVVIAK